VGRWAGSTWGVDAAIAATALAIECSSVALANGASPYGSPGEWARLTPTVVAFLVLMHLPLLWRQRHPLPVLVLALIAAVAAIPLLRIPLAGWGVLGALFEYGARGRVVRSAVAAVAVYVALLFSVMALTPGDPVPSVAGVAVLFLNVATPWGLGVLTRAVRGRRARERDSDRLRDAAEAVAAERARVARELHDVLAHSVSVIVLQAAGAREVLATQPERAAEALANIEAAGRESLVEVRRLLRALREHDGEAPGLAPRPGVDDLSTLIGQVREAGLRVHYSMAGERGDLDPSVDLSAYRIVQEALTNVLKHAGQTAATVTLDWREEGFLRVEVRDGGRGPLPGVALTGNGLFGMRERAVLVGGSLEAGAAPGGGFQVVAILPTARGRAAVTGVAEQ
jgi:signal transduction histidine kinase